jgi:hypothetical protein
LFITSFTGNGLYVPLRAFLEKEIKIIFVKKKMATKEVRSEKYEGKSEKKKKKEKNE